MRTFASRRPAPASPIDLCPPSPPPPRSARPWASSLGVALLLAHGAGVARAAEPTPAAPAEAAGAPAKAEPTSTAAAEAPGAPAKAAPASTVAAPPPWVDSRRRVSLRLGFAHWFSQALGQPDGYRSPSLNVTVRAGIPYLEIGGRYTLVVDGLRLPSGARNVVGFASLEVLAGREMRIGMQHLHAFAGVFGSLVNTEAPAVGYGWGGTFGVDYLIGTRAGLDHAVGIFMAVRGIFYVLPGEPGPTGYLDGWHRDLHFDLGVVTAFL